MSANSIFVAKTTNSLDKSVKLSCCQMHHTSDY